MELLTNDLILRPVIESDIEEDIRFLSSLKSNSLVMNAMIIPEKDEIKNE